MKVLCWMHGAPTCKPAVPTAITKITGKTAADGKREAVEAPNKATNFRGWGLP